MKTILISLAAMLLVLFSSCSEESVAVKPQPVVVERPAPPFEGAVWIEPEYRWSHNNYVVVPGRWERGRGVWVPGHWVEGGRGFRWVPGHWR